MPVTRVVLYKNGVGYFEHSGKVRGSQNLNIDFTTAQLNDVLKSLTVLDLGKGRITGVTYNSTAPLANRLESLRIPFGENPNTAQFLQALRGARLEVRSAAASITGRLLGIDELETTDKEGNKTTISQISIVGDTGEVRVFDLAPQTSVRVVEKDVNEEIGKYLGLVASVRDRDVRRMTISTAGDGERNFLISYISEVPVWKCTYRIVVPSDGKPLLQGWAVVDNTVGEDWKNVELSLVAGAPQSFVQALSQPYYTRRPVVPLPENAMLTPQTHEATIETNIENGPPPPVSMQAGVVGGVPGGVPGGALGGIVGGLHSPKSLPLAQRFDADEAAKELEASTTVAQTAELGDLFQYRLKDHVTIRKNQSAMVPILQSRVEAEKVSVWNPSESSVRRALWVENTSNLTLDGGSFNVLEGDAFAGEGLMDTIKPGEKRLLSYAADLGLVVDAKEKIEPEQATQITIGHGVMIEISEERQERTYTLRNRDTSNRIVIIEHPARSGWKLASGETPVESSASYHRFRLTVEPKKTASLVVKEVKPVGTRYELTNLTRGQLDMFVQQKTINPEVEQALRRIIMQKDTVAAIEADIAARKGHLSAIAEDQQRVRENMKALKGSAEEKSLVERYARELNEQEDRVQSLQREIAELQQKRDSEQTQLNGMIEQLQMTVTL